MSLTQALASSLSGLRTTQAGLALIASNVANSETPGYIRKTLVQREAAIGPSGVSVRASAVNRELDVFVQRQLRVERSGSAYAGLRADFYSRLQGIYGEPGSENALETQFNRFTSALHALSTTPESSSARGNALSAAQALAQQLNGMSADIQNLRLDAEHALADAISLANDAARQIASVNGEVLRLGSHDVARAALLDQRDRAIEQLSALMDIRVIAGDSDQVSVFTTSGVQIVGTQASTLNFDSQGAIGPEARWHPDLAQRGVGTITLVGAGSNSIDLVANGAFRSGRIAALLEMRDQVLVDAQAQLDEAAAVLARSLSDRTIAGTAATAGTQAGFDLNIGGVLPGNTIELSYFDTLANAQKKLTIVRVDDPAALPLPDGNDPNHRVIGVDFTGGMASVVNQIADALGSSFAVTNPSGNTLRILDDGAGGVVNVTALRATQTATSLSGGSAELPLFTDGPNVYSGAIASFGSQLTGFAGRISLNASLLANPAALVAYSASAPAGDATRPEFLYRQLTSSAFDFAPSAALPIYRGTLGDYLSNVTSGQGQAAASASQLADGQQIVVEALQQRMNDTSGVNVDEEMAHLLTLQTAYAANARVMTAVQEMIDALLEA
jgi:flagellar hook-associated protein 1